MKLQAVEVHSSVPLQKLLYFNVFNSIFFVAVHIGLAVYKTLYAPSPSPINKYLLPALISVYAVVEIVRLLLGYSGNLKERVPELSAGWLLALFPQFPIVVFLTFLQGLLNDSLPLDLAVGIPALFFLVCEIVLTFSTIKALIAKQTADFYRLVQRDSLSAAAAEAAAQKKLESTLVVSSLAVLLRQSAAPLPSVTVQPAPRPRLLDVAREGVAKLARASFKRPVIALPSAASVSKNTE